MHSSLFLLWAVLKHKSLRSRYNEAPTLPSPVEPTLMWLVHGQPLCCLRAHPARLVRRTSHNAAHE